MKDVTLIHGDCLVEMLKLPKGSVDMVFCDPPYGFFSDGELDWDVALNLDAMWECLAHVCRPDAVIVLMGAEPFSSHLRLSVNKEGNPFNFKFDYIWLKDKGTNFQLSAYMPMKIHEFGHVFYSKFRLFHPNGRPLAKPYTREFNRKKNMKHLGKDGMQQHFVKTYTHETPTNVIYCPWGDSKDRVHPTQKPVGFIKEVIEHHSNEGDRVLDFTAGSGSAGVACIKTGRRFIGIERDPEYFAIMRDRLAKPIIRENPADDWSNNMPLAQAGLFDAK